MTNTTLKGKPDEGNPHVRFDEGVGALEKPRPRSLIYNRLVLTIVCTLAVAGASAGTITNLTVRSEKMEREIPVTIVLPDAHDGDFVWVQFGCK